jgi:hypothetical protein
MKNVIVMSKKATSLSESIFTLLYELYGDKLIHPKKTYIKGTKASLVETKISIDGTYIFLRILRQKEFRHFELVCSDTDTIQTATVYLKLTSLVPLGNQREIISWHFGSDLVSQTLRQEIQKTSARNVTFIAADRGDIVIPLLKSVPMKKTVVTSYVSA